MWIPVILVSLLLGVSSGAPSIHWRDPYWLASGGGTTLYIYGSGFSEDHFNYFDDTLGNRVLLVNDDETIECDVIDYLSNTNKIVCSAGPRENSGAPTVYGVKVFSDGVAASGYRTVRYSDNHGPTLQYVTPRWSLPGALIHLTGWFRTDQYVDIDYTDPTSVDTTTATTINSVYMNMMDCDMLNATTGELFSDLTSKDLDCLVTTKYIGPMNASMYVANRGGSIIERHGLFVDSKDRLFQHHTYAGVSSITPATGSSGGGTLLTINGIGLDPTPGATEVAVGGAPCQVVDVTDDSVSCLVPPEAETGPASSDLGLLLEVWDGIIIHDLSDDLTWNGLSSSNGTSYSASAQIEDEFDIDINEPTAIAKISGFLHAPHDGVYSISFSTGWEYNYFVAADGNPANKVPLNVWQEFSMSADTPAYLEIRLKGFADTHFKAVMNDFNSKYNNYQTGRAANEVHRVILDPSIKWETQRLTTHNAGTASLYMHGFSSEPIDVSDPDAVREALLGLTEKQCEVVGEDPKFALDYNFEDGEDNPKNIRGSRVNDIEPWCGRGSYSLYVIDPRIYQENEQSKMKDVNKYPYLCFALRGNVQPNMRVTFRWKDNEGRSRTSSIWFDHNYDVNSNSWQYQCMDLVSVAISDSWMANQRANDSLLLLHRAYAPKPVTPTEDVFIDKFALCDENIDVVPSRPSAVAYNNILVTDIGVDIEDGNTMDIVFETSNCAGDFPLLGVHTGAANASWLTGLDSAMSQTFDVNGGNASVERLQTATNPVSGSWSLDFLGTTVTGISPSIEELPLEAMLEALSGAGDMKVSRSGNCQEYKWDIEWKTNPGRKDVVTADSSALVFDGDSLILETKRKTDGKIWHDPLAADFFTAMRKEPWVSVKVNGYTAASLGNCAFEYDDFGAPTVASVAGSTDGNGVVTITIMGSDFNSAIAGDYKVMVGTNPCTGITVIPTTEITCTVDYLAAGTYPIYVSMQPFGASLPHSVTYTVSLSITSVSPATGGTGGGFEIVVSGTGFPADLTGWAGNSVSLGGVDCAVVSADKTSVTCIAPAHAAGVVNVSVSVSSETVVSVDAFTYNAALSGSLTSVSPTTSSVLGGDTLTISGTNLGDGTDGNVMVGGSPCEVDVWTSTSITCSLPSNPPGVQPVTVYTGPEGYASGSATVTYVLEITAVSPSVGSINGGTVLVIKGQGFGTNCSLLSVTLGGGMECEVISCTEMEVKCITKVVPQNHVIDNLGSHPTHGMGFAWNPKHLVVQEGDSVTWTWNKVNEHDTLLHNVFQTPSATDTLYGSSGFHSGAQTLAGSMTVTFPNAGTFFYAGDPVGASEVIMSGRVDVKKPSEMALKIKLFLSGTEANSLNSGNSVTVTIDSCGTFLDTPVDVDCNSTAPVAPTDSDLYFTTDECYTPVVTTVTASSTEEVPGLSGIQVKAGVMLTITGDGFGTDLCQSSVSVGDATCTVSTSTTDTIECTLDDLNNMVSLKAQPVVVTVANRGTASVNVADFSSEGEINILPVVESFTPAIGSVAGGTVITITGTGLKAFDSQATVQLGSGVCNVDSVTPTEIKCTTVATSASVVTLAVSISGFNIPAINEMDSSSYEFSDAVTPTVSSVSIFGPTVAVTGTNFGTATSAVTVTLAHTSLRINKVEEAHHQRKKTEAKPLEKEIKYEYIRAEFDELMKAFNEDGEEILSPEHIRLRSGMLDHIDVSATDFWARLTKTSAKSLDESLRLEGVWRMAGSNIINDVEPTNEVEEPLRTGTRVASSYDCVPSSVADTQISCSVTNLPAGQYDVSVTIEGVGDASTAGGDATVTAVPEVSGIAPTNGSTNGGTLLTISGSGFTPGEITVTVGGETCHLVSEGEMIVECLTAAHEAGSVSVDFTSGGATSSSVGTFTYDSDMTPMISSVVPNTGLENNTELTLSGTGFTLSGSDPEVTVGGVPCTVTSASMTSVKCNSPDMMGGSYEVILRDVIYGYSNDDKMVDYEFSITGVSPNQGGYGGAKITINGKGFSPDGDTTVMMCGKECAIMSASSTAITCQLPPLESDQSSVNCNVTVANPVLRTGGADVTLPGGFTYDSSLTPTVTEITPKRGGTAGGTTVSITGTNFGDSGNTVTIGGSICVIQTQSINLITCVTEAHAGPGYFPVMVTDSDGSIATTDENGVFFYIDRWSSIYTWGGGSVPSEGQLVGVSTGQTLLIDESTEVLGMLLIDGGHVIVDPEAVSEIVLKAEYILILKGGSLSIGSEDEPYPGQAVIELHGNTRSIELPTYGAKVLAVRNGTLDLHGQYIPVTWTYLDATAPAGTSTISLKQPVTWKAGDEIVIATTEKRFMVNENEQRTIASVSGDGRTLTLTEPLDYEHLSIEQTLGGRTIETRAEVGLLTRNVKVRGNINQDFVETIEACDEAWHPGQFSVQSCFNGRFGEEIGGDQFGATVMLAGKNPEYNLVVGRIEYVEVTEAGQAFQLGRYPLHFHLVDNVNTSYIRGCAVHRTFNRAVTIHAANYLHVERNVVYNNMGHAIFTEDGVEEHNIIEYNLAIFTRTSSSLLNVDITPSAYWVVNPNNIVRHNAAAGGTHFGYWYRLEEHPSGPSATDSICQNKAPMGQFFNNTAHSMGRYGLWVFSMDGYFPKDNGCSGNNLVAAWHDFTVWHCDRGAEVVIGGALQFHNFVALDNSAAGLEMVKVSGDFGVASGPGVFDSLVIGHSDLTPSGCTGDGIVAPKQYIFTISNTTFVNYDTGGCAALSGCSQCKEFQGGFRVKVDALSFDNANQKLRFKWEHETIWMDSDGSLSGTADAFVVPDMAILPPTDCMTVPEFSLNPEAPGSRCTVSKFLRFDMNGLDVEPESLQYRDLIVSNDHGNTSVPYRTKRLTIEGWMGILPTGDTYKYEFDNAAQITNITYKSDIFFVESGDYFYVEQEFMQIPDAFGTTEDMRNSSDALPDPVTGYHGDYYWDNDTRTMTYLVSSNEKPTERGKMGPGEQREIDFVVYRCFYENCIMPTPPPVPTGRPDQTFRWSDVETWKEVPVGSGGHPTNDTYNLPVEGDEIIIPLGMWLIVDTVTPKLDRVYVYGALEFEDVMDHQFEATIIYIQGGTVVAGFSEDTPFTHNLKITLRGSLDPNDPDNVDMPMPFGIPNVGWKAIGAFGSLYLHGEVSGNTWLKLGATANAGDTELTLAEIPDPSWLNQEVMVTSTGKDPKETEVRTITAISGSTITLNEALDFEHLGETYTLSDGTEIIMAGEVGRLTRNIVIEGNDYDTLYNDSFGGRVLISKMNVDGIDYDGQAQLVGVEFRNMGQEGFTDPDDPRYSLAFHGLGTNDGSNYVKKCSFNTNFNAAIGLFGSNNITFEDNVVYFTVGSAIEDESSDNVYRRNLVAVSLFTGTYNGREETENLKWEAAFMLAGATDPVLEGNVVGGAEQAGYRTYGEPCSAQTLWMNNEVHSAIYGFMLWKKGGAGPPNECRRLNSVYAWRVWDTAFYMQHYASLFLTDVTAVDCEVGANLLVYAPPALSHGYHEKTATVEDSLFVGATPAHTCDYQASTSAIVGPFFSDVLWSPGSGIGNAGILFGSFMSSANKAPKKPFHPADNYPALYGGTFINRVTFANYDNRTCGKDFAFLSNKDTDDGTHPIFTSGLTFLDTPESNYMFLFEPNLGRVNPSDCVDMDCDGHKKIIVTDLDGTLLGSVNATATSQAEFEWNGDASRGVGDYRIPVALKQNLDGTQIVAEDKFPNKGIVRDGSCSLMTSWRAWKCTSLRHRMMIIESMDSDTEIRRLSPIALIADPGTNGYVDLLNGPMDRGWCMGYTCQERISTFYSVVATNYVYEVGLTSTPPQVIRFHLLHADPSESVLLRIFFPKSQRYDVYVDGTYVPPTNIDDTKPSYQLLPNDPLDPEKFFPTLADDAGTNYLQRTEKFFHVVLRGGSVIDIKTSPTIILTTGVVMDPDDLFEGDVINNMALMLGISPENIRVVDVIREDSTRSGLMRVTQNITNVEFEIASAPTTTINGSTSDLDAPVIEYNDLVEAMATGITAFQSGDCSECNITIASISMIEPETPPEVPEGHATEEVGSVVIEGGDLFSNVQQELELQALNNSLVPEVYDQPGGSTLDQDVPAKVKAFEHFPVQPMMSVQSTEGELIDALGHESDPWIVEVSLSGGPSDAVLLGTTSVPYGNGSASFTDLSVNSAGNGYYLTFSIVYPSSAPSLTVVGSKFNAAPKKVFLAFTSVPKFVTAQKPFSIEMTLTDKDTSLPMDPSQLTGLEMAGDIKLARGGKGKGKLEGNTGISQTDGSMSVFIQDGLIITKKGHNKRLKVKANVEGPGWKLKALSDRITILPEGIEIPEDAITKEVTMVGLFGRLQAIKNKLQMFAKRVVSEIQSEVGTAAWVDPVGFSNGKKPVAKMSLIGSEAQISEALDKLCEKIRSREIKVRVSRQKFIMSGVKVDGDKLANCSII